MKRILPLLLLAPSAAFAHPGHVTATPFLSGLSHPVGGADHLLAMIAVGLCAAMAGGRALWALPLAFLTAMLGGGVMGALGFALPGVEPMILASVIALGLAAALALRPGLAASVAMVALFGLFHGHAHGTEGQATAGYALGFLIATAALHGAGVALGLGLQSRLARALGGLTAAAGLALAFA